MLHVRVCLCITCTDTFNTAVVWIFLCSKGNQNIVLWHHDSDRARLLLQFADCAVEAMFKQDNFRKKEGIFQFSAGSWKGFSQATTSHWQSIKPWWADFDFEANYSTILPSYAANTSNKHRVAPVRTQKQPWLWIIRGNILFQKDKHRLLLLIAVIQLSLMRIVIIEVNSACIYSAHSLLGQISYTKMSRWRFKTDFDLLTKLQ